MSLNFYDEIDPRFGRIERRLQRIGWGIIAVVLLLAIAGLFGGGFLSNATARHAADGRAIELTYPRFGRQESSLEMTLKVTAPRASGPELSVLLSGDILDSATITGISPQPDSEAVSGDAIVYTWTVESWEGPQAIEFSYESRDWRSVGGRVDVLAGDEALGGLSFEQFLFP